MSQATNTHVPVTAPIAVSTHGYQYPTKRLHRWLLRIGLSLPYALIAIFYSRISGFSSTAAPALPNSDLATNASPLSTLTISDLDRMFPPLPNLISGLFGGNQLLLALTGSVVGGLFLTAVLRRMKVAGLKNSEIALALIALGANPLFAYNAIGDLSAMMAISLFGIAMIDTYMFARRGDTAAGFRAGVFLMIAVLSDWNGIIYTLVLCLTVPLLRPNNSLPLNRTSAPRANLLVVAFPSVATTLSVMLLDWVFLGDPVSLLRNAIDYHPELWRIFTATVTTPRGLIRLLPLLLLVGLAFTLKRLTIIPLGIAVFLIVQVSYVFGILQANNAGGLFLTMFLVSVAIMIEANRMARRAWAYWYWALFMVAGWLFASTRLPITNWIDFLSSNWR